MKTYAQGPLVAVDPGVHACGVAEFFGGVLIHAGLTDAPVVYQGTGCVVCEIPEQRGRTTNIRMSDLIELAVAAGRMTGAVPTDRVEYVTPSRWKGQLPKKIQHARMLACLYPPEIETLAMGVEPTESCLRHNIYDAVCLGLVTLERM